MSCQPVSFRLRLRIGLLIAEKEKFFPASTQAGSGSPKSKNISAENLYGQINCEEGVEGKLAEKEYDKEFVVCFWLHTIN